MIVSGDIRKLMTTKKNAGQKSSTVGLLKRMLRSLKGDKRVVVLNVRGTKIQATEAALTRHGDSRLARMFQPGEDDESGKRAAEAGADVFQNGPGLGF